MSKKVTRQSITEHLGFYNHYTISSCMNTHCTLDKLLQELQAAFPNDDADPTTATNTAEGMASDGDAPRRVGLVRRKMSPIAFAKLEKLYNNFKKESLAWDYAFYEITFAKKFLYSRQYQALVDRQNKRWATVYSFDKRFEELKKAQAGTG